MKTDDFDYYLDESLIAQTPLKQRDSSRLMVLDRETGNVSHHVFHDIIDYLNKGDTLVLNDTKVIPARIIGVKEETGAVIELLLLNEVESDTWKALTKPARRVKVGTVINFGEGLIKATCIKEEDEGIREFSLEYNGILYEILDKLGTMPLPPYIHEKLEDQSRYQTVYAKNIGSAAAPTAGLHFTNDLLERIKAKGINVCFVTLHVGLGTFRPVKVDDVTKHVMHTEWYQITSETAKIIMDTKKRGNKVIAVGTTSTRTLETVATKFNGEIKPDSGNTNIFIYPGYEFKCIDGLITNFHLPKSTLVMLVSALAGKDNIMNAYSIAVKERYRFFSFGDAMFIK